MSFFRMKRKKLPIDTQQIEQAIEMLEQKTSAELRVVVESKARLKTNDNPAIARANALFEELNMDKTAERNAVLLYLCLKPHYLAVVGDRGIHHYVGDDFWQSVYQSMKKHAEQADYTQALCAGIQQVGEQLVQYFPRQADDKNELPNEVVLK